MSKWTDEAIVILLTEVRKGTSDREIADILSQHFNCTFTSDAVRNKRKRLLEKEATPTVQERVDEYSAKAVSQKKTKENKELLKALADKDEEIGAILQLKETPQIIKLSPPLKGKVQAYAVAVYSDWHCEEEVKSAKVNDLNEFNLVIADKRIKNCFQNTQRLVELSQQNAHLDGGIIALLGDFISGNIHEELVEITLLSPVEAIQWVQARIVSGLRFLLKETNLTYTIVCQCGNHPRITKRVHSSAEQGNSLEYYMYHNLKLIFAEESRFNWLIAESYHSYLALYGYKIRFHHGHKIKFFKAIGGIFMSAYRYINEINKAIPAWLDVFGHHHQQRNGNTFISNGSLIGTTPYSLSEGYAHERPRQKFFLFSSKGEVISEHPIFLD